MANQLLLLFEANLHPNHTFSRISSAIFILDSLIQGMGLLVTDVHESAVSIFPPLEIPVASPRALMSSVAPGATVIPSEVSYFFDDKPPDAPIASKVGHGFEYDPTLTWEKLMDLRPLHRMREGEPTWKESHHSLFDEAQLAPTVDMNWAQRWAHWPETDSKAEIQKEEIRRLCWSAMILASLFREFAPYMNQITWDLHITKQENVRRCSCHINY